MKDRLKRTFSVPNLIALVLVTGAAVLAYLP